MLKIMTLETAPRGPLGDDRGDKISLVDASLGTSNIDVHYNVLRPGGQRGRYHRHSQADNVYIVAKGTGELIADGQTHQLQAGQIVFLPAGMPHSLSNVSDAPFEIFEIYAPAGEKFDFQIVE